MQLFRISKYMQLVLKRVLPASPFRPLWDNVFSLCLSARSETRAPRVKGGQRKKDPQGPQKDLIKQESFKGAIRRIHAMERRIFLHPPHGLLPVYE